MLCRQPFCSGAETRYSPVEGEALAVAWGLKKCRYFLEGCQNLSVGVDHKPLLGLYSPTKGLADIENNRLRRLVEKATQYRFAVFHIPGARNLIADGLSRSPVGPAVHLDLEGGEKCALARAAVRGTSAAAWLALAGARKLDPMEDEVAEAREMSQDE